MEANKIAPQKKKFTPGLEMLVVTKYIKIFLCDYLTI